MVECPIHQQATESSVRKFEPWYLRWLHRLTDRLIPSLDEIRLDPEDVPGSDAHCYVPRTVRVYSEPRESVLVFDESFGQFRDAMNTPEATALRDAYPERYGTSEPSVFDRPRWCVGGPQFPRECQHHMDDYRLWHLGWANLRSTQICGTTPCGVMVGCLDETRPRWCVGRASHRIIDTHWYDVGKYSIDRLLTPCGVMVGCESPRVTFGHLRWCDIPRTWWERPGHPNPCGEVGHG
jgi:hypothetical protein